MNNFNSLNKFNKDLVGNLRDTIYTDWNNYTNIKDDMQAPVGKEKGGKCNIV